MNAMQFLVFIAALLVSSAFTRWVRDFANARGWSTKPSSERHLHTRPIPRLGGVAIFLTLWCMLPLAHWVPGYPGMPQNPLPYFSLRILGPATIIFLLGLIDDFCGLNAYLKFAVQAGAAIILFWNGIGISHLSFIAGNSYLGWLFGVPLTVLWVLWITNAFNLIDGLDGLAAGSALFSTLVTCIVAILFHNEGTLFLSMALAGAIAGFLRYNFNPASVFLGDCGSLSIGFLLSAIALAGSQKSPTVVAIAIPMVSLGLPILDVAVAVIRRFLSRKRLFEPDRDHIHHKLLSRGISHRQAVLLLYGVSACFGLLSLFLLDRRGMAIATVLVVTGIGVLIGVQQLRYPEFSELARVAKRTLNQRHVIANDISIRRTPDALRSCTTLTQFCQILKQCLKPVGFDGFSLCLLSEFPIEVEVDPFIHASGRNLQFFWDHSTMPSETNWSLTFSLLKSNGKRAGSFTLYRKNATSPLWIDLDLLTATGFSNAVAAVVEKLQESWVAKIHKEKAIREFETVRPGMTSGMPQPAVVPTSG
jgi:UDP-GlcNAc:undecaprenyl-phosphate/decaprenyl-phosphate GlcNAc-1-phosphate transferase